MVRRRTKIVATLGPATDPPDVIDAIIAAGVDCARVNCSHGSADERRRRAADARAAAEKAGRPLALLFDLQGPKLRLGGVTQERAVQRGETVVFAGAELGPAPGRVTVDFRGLAGLVTPRSQIVIGDGVPRFAVERVDDGEVTARALAPGWLVPRKGVNVTYAQPRLPAITEKDVADLALAVECGADVVALSFVRSAGDVDELRARLRDHGSRARTVAKIEKIEAHEALDEILHVADGVMVARGDYGVEAGVARVPLMQKDTIYRGTRAGKLVITATQMLESMIGSPEPTRAEAADVANAVLDGTSAVMLSAETAIGSYPVEAVRAMAEIAHLAEDSLEIHGVAEPVEAERPDAAVMRAATRLADEVDAVALIVPTTTGGAPRSCAKYRRHRPIIALATDPTVANQLAVEWGIQPTTLDVAGSVDELIDAALERARDHARLPSGARAVLTAGRRTGTPGATNLIMLRDIP